ncbi:hypothetical protein GCM10020331_021920 [Ectobacillus funiculus]
MQGIFRFHLEIQKKSVNMIEEYIDSLLADGKFPLGLGGEHLVSWPVMKAMYKKSTQILRLFIFDAHTDLRDNYEGEPYSHATPIKKVCNLIGPKKMCIHSGSALV